MNEVLISHLYQHECVRWLYQVGVNAHMYICACMCVLRVCVRACSYFMSSKDFETHFALCTLNTD